MAESRQTPVVARGRFLAELLTVTQRRVTRELGVVLADEGCTLDEWRVMRHLADGDGHLMGELANSLVIPDASLTRLVDTLSRSSLVYRRQSSHDRRKVAVYLSREGHSRLARLDALVEAHDARFRASDAWGKLAETLCDTAEEKA